MDITIVKVVNDDDGNHVSYLLGNELHVPLDPANRHYAAIQEWIAEGNTIQEAEE